MFFHMYLQSSSHLTRKVYVWRKGGFTLKTNELLHLMIPLYGAMDTGDYWQEKMINHLKVDLQMPSTTGGLAFRMQVTHGKLEGVIDVHVDDTIGAGSN